MVCSDYTKLQTNWPSLAPFMASFGGEKGDSGDTELVLVDLPELRSITDRT